MHRPRVLFVTMLLLPLACDVNHNDGDGCGGCTGPHLRYVSGSTTTSGDAALRFADGTSLWFAAGEAADAGHMALGPDGLTFYRKAVVRVLAEADVDGDGGAALVGIDSGDVDALGPDAADAATSVADSGLADAGLADAEALDASAADLDAATRDGATESDEPVTGERFHPLPAAPVARLALPSVAPGDAGPSLFHLTRCRSSRATLVADGCTGEDGLREAPEEVDVAGRYFTGTKDSDVTIQVNVLGVRVDYTTFYRPDDSVKECY